MTVSKPKIAIVLAAGLGTRLKPLTHFFPKTGLPILNRPIAYHLIKQFLDFGFKEVHCNVHYKHAFLMEEIHRSLIEDGHSKDQVRFWYEPELLESGGTILHIAHSLFKETKLVADVAVASGDIYAPYPYQSMCDQWSTRQSDQIILLSTRPIPEGQTRKDATFVDKTCTFVKGFGLSANPAMLSQTDRQRLFTSFQFIDGAFLLSLPSLPGPVRENVFNAGLFQNKTILNHCYEAAYNPHEWYDIGTLSDYKACLKHVGSLQPQRCEGEIDYKGETLIKRIEQSGLGADALSRLSERAYSVYSQSGGFAFDLRSRLLEQSAYAGELPLYLEASFFLRGEEQGNGTEGGIVFRFNKP